MSERLPYVEYDKLYWDKDYCWTVSVMAGEILIEHNCPKTVKTRTYANYKYNSVNDMVSYKNALTCAECFETCPLEVFEKWLFLGAMYA